MGKVIVFTQPKTIRIEDQPDPPLEAKQVRVQTLFSGISAGTELTAYRGSNPYLHKQWEATSRLFLRGDTPSQPYPLVGWGYEEVGKVIEIGTEVTEIRIGDVIYGTWGHRTHHILEESYASKRIKPAGLDPLLAIYSHLGPIALNGILDANIHIGENVAIFGLGVVGQVTAQLAKRSGAWVFGIDLIEKRLSLARELGAIDVAINPQHESPAEKIKSLTNGRGADVSIEVSGSARALHEAIRATAYAARVVSLGFIQGEASGLYLGEEFHHNRIQLICSQISNVDPALTHRWDRLRLIHMIMSLQVDGMLNLRPLITHIVPFQRAAEAFEILDATPAEALQVVLDFANT
ncbi:MAG: zinc-binding alcohol dehydrogenase [Chloroflexi bacterium]|nr:zinc-binding alcohol dehydrogenase [Chloroflexota bacterium]MBI5350975.1 zinc-binding alcohol dehydrogenase [Chloroflexota bacterium]MBI5714203.1 zinc-binding alcohol dehydrogenase [Chloroflexota bacterium]